MKLTLPDLKHRGVIQLAFLAGGMVLAVSPGIYGGVGAGWILALFLLGAVIGGLLIRFSPALAIEFPNSDATVGDLSRDVLALNYSRLGEEAGSWNEKDLWEALCRIIVRETGVARERITPEARLVDNLGVE